MKIEFLKKQSFSRKLFFLFLGISTLPIIISFLYVLNISRQTELIQFHSVILFFTCILLLIGIFAVLASISVAKRISKPIRQFTKSATEIARGNFNHKVQVYSDDELGKLAKIINFMTTELRRLNEMNLNKIISEKNKTETIIKNIGDGVIVTDTMNKILVLNSIAESWFGLNEIDIINQPIEKLIYEQNVLSLINKMRAENDNESPTVEINITPDNKRKQLILQAKAARVINSKNKLIGIVTIFRDITKEKEIDKMKTELVSMVAHELRSPLTSIAGFSELLLDTGVTREQSKEYAEIILKESNRLGDLINKFLDISRIESGKSQIHKTNVSIDQIIESILEMNMYLAERKGMHVNIEIPENISSVVVDREMIGEVILNLFSNAVKYSPLNKSISITLQDEENEQIVSIADKGYGISEESLSKVFDKFYRVTDNEKIQEINGSGLGLSLVKEIIELHNGSIWVKSEINRGSTFSFSIPKTKSDDSQYQLIETYKEMDIIE